MAILKLINRKLFPWQQCGNIHWHGCIALNCHVTAHPLNATNPRHWLQKHKRSLQRSKDQVMLIILPLVEMVACRVCYQLSRRPPLKYLVTIHQLNQNLWGKRKQDCRGRYYVFANLILSFPFELDWVLCTYRSFTSDVHMQLSTCYAHALFVWFTCA